MSDKKYMPPVDHWKDWPLQQAAVLQLLRRKFNRKTLFQPDYDANRCVFVHIPKAAGTSIKNVLFPHGQHITHYRAIDYLLDSPLKFSKYFVFTFSRNPYDRLVSAYNFITQGGKNEADTRFRDKFLSDYPDFGGFVRNGLARKEFAKSYHFMPQFPFVLDGFGRTIVDFVGRVENMADDFTVVARKIGVDAQLGHANRSQRGPYQDFYTEELRAIAYAHYKKDFEIFGYSSKID